MTRATNARIAGTTFLVYIASSIASMLLCARATTGAEPIEGIGGMDMSRPLGLLWFATAAGAPGVDAGAAPRSAGSC